MLHGLLYTAAGACVVAEHSVKTSHLLQVAKEVGDKLQQGPSLQHDMQKR